MSEERRTGPRVGLSSASNGPLGMVISARRFPADLTLISATRRYSFPWPRAKSAMKILRYIRRDGITGRKEKAGKAP